MRRQWAKPRKTDLTDEQIAYCISEYNRGRNTRCLADEFGVSATTIVLRMEAAGAPRRRRGAVQLITPEIAQAAKDLRATGLAWNWVAKRIGFSESALKREIRKLPANDAVIEQEQAA